MKKILLTLAACSMASLTMPAVNPSDLIIYINPGHGGHDSDDRNVVIEPFAQGDPEGFWESNANLDKGLMLRELLQAKGIKVYMSRVTNTTADDLGLTTIGRLANEKKADFFFSIHSNATGTSSRTNFPLMLYRGYDDEPVRENAKKMSGILGKHLYENGVTVWTNNYAIRGDWSFYKSWGTSGLGVLRALTVDGMLSEGSFHDYIPETYRLMNNDFKWLEAWHFRKAVDEYFGLQGDTKGVIIGRVNDSRFLREGSYKMFNEDLLTTVDGAKIELYNADKSKKLAEYVTDNLFNGVYAFKDLEPGTYNLVATKDTHYTYETSVEVKADCATYANIKMDKVRNTPPVVVSYSPVWKEGDEPLLCNTKISFTFNWDMDTKSTERAFSITPAVEGKFVWSESNTVMTFVPSVPFATNTNYKVVLSTEASHPGNMNLEKPFELSFFTTDRNFMEMLGHFPKNGDDVHYKGASIELRFDKYPATRNILNQITITDSKGAKVSLNTRGMTYSKTGDEYGFVRIPFTKSLTVGESYHIELSDKIADADGITLSHGESIDFKAVDAGEAKNDQKNIDGFDDATLFTFNSDDSKGFESAKVSGDTKERLFGTSAVAVDYVFVKNNEEPGELTFDRSVPSELTVSTGDIVSAHIYGDLSGNELFAQFTSETNVKYAKIANLDYLGWKYIEIPLTELEGGVTYTFTGFKLIEVPTQMSHKGMIRLDDLNMVKENSGVETVEIAGVTVGPNPASELLVANADMLISSVELVSMSGATVASASGNVINVSSIADGVYFAKITLANSGNVAVKKIIVKH